MANHRDQQQQQQQQNGRGRGGRGRGGFRGRGRGGRGRGRGFVRKNNNNRTPPRRPQPLNINVTTPPAPAGPKIFDLLLGGWGPVFRTSQQLKDFQTYGIMKPGKLMIIKSANKDLNLSNFDDTEKKFRNMIVRYTPDMVSEFCTIYDEQLAENDGNELENDEIISLRNHLVADLNKAIAHYKPIRVFIVIETFGPVAGVLAMVARQNEFVAATINEVGRRKLHEIVDEDLRTKEYCRRLNQFLVQHHPRYRHVGDLSDDKPIVVDEIV